MAHTALKATSENFWNFDSRCSRHMTSKRSFLKNISPTNHKYATRGDSVKERALVEMNTRCCWSTKEEEK